MAIVTAYMPSDSDLIPTYKELHTPVMTSQIISASPSGKEFFDVYNKGIKTSTSVPVPEKPVTKNVDKSAIFNRRPTWFIDSEEDMV